VALSTIVTLAFTGHAQYALPTTIWRPGFAWVVVRAIAEWVSGMIAPHALELIPAAKIVVRSVAEWVSGVIAPHALELIPAAKRVVALVPLVNISILRCVRAQVMVAKVVLIV